MLVWLPDADTEVPIKLFKRPAGGGGGGTVRKPPHGGGTKIDL